MHFPPAQTDDDAPVVLLIDDCRDVYRLLDARLRSESIELEHADTGDAGLERARETAPAIILLDLEMPGRDGFEVLRELKEDRATMDIPVIVLSGLSSPHDKVTAFDLGAVDYITKPFELTELRVRVRSALRLHRLMRMLAQKAQIDGLTGLWNRQYFDERLSSEVSRVARAPGPLSLALLDLDHFKSINDTYGHPAGDAVLQSLASLLQQTLRAGDLACRYGGEEFALIMPETTPTDAEAVCERVRVALEQRRWPRHPDRTVTVSIGLVGCAAGCALTSAEWVERADKALYAAKSGGRNRIVTEHLKGPATLRDSA